MAGALQGYSGGSQGRSARRRDTHTGDDAARRCSALQSGHPSGSKQHGCSRIQSQATNGTGE